ncbi:MAG TPA: rRNA maturation RNase YbeY [Candidatus Saccharimonadales bacterium]|nr:rRNA maturation RNase YbeY [Candidatus Saccharimonadales bacterium]
MALKLALSGPLPKGVKKALLEAVITALNATAQNLPNGTINLKLVDDSEIRALNKKYSGNDYATDVLSFNYLEDGAEPGGEIGDMAISRETAERQAAKAGTDLETEIVLLFIHGCLHLIGLDHADSSGRRRMEIIQAGLMHDLGLTYRNFEWDSSAA